MLKKFKSLKANKKGFTLAELLIVVAIIAVLAAIAIPVFATQLDKAREQVDDANLRSAVSLAQADFLTKKLNEETTYYFDTSSIQGSSQSLVIGSGKTFRGQSTAHKDETITVVINADSSVKSAGWINPATT